MIKPVVFGFLSGLICSLLLGAVISVTKELFPFVNAFNQNLNNKYGVDVLLDFAMLLSFFVAGLVTTKYANGRVIFAMVMGVILLIVETSLNLLDMMPGIFVNGSPLFYQVFTSILAFGSLYLGGAVYVRSKKFR